MGKKCVNFINKKETPANNSKEVCWGMLGKIFSLRFWDFWQYIKCKDIKQIKIIYNNCVENVKIGKKMRKLKEHQGGLRKWVMQKGM